MTGVAGPPVRYPFLDHPGPLAFAHRGGAGEAPENTFAAFDHAVSLGYRYLETDVHATADGVVVCIHDADLARVAGRPGLVRALLWRDVAAAALPGSQRVPRLDELLERYPQARFNVDTKHPSVVAPLAEVIQRSGALERVCVTSFSDQRLATIRRLLGPRLCTSVGPRGVAALRAASYLGGRATLARAWAGAAAAQIPLTARRVQLADRRFVDAAHRAGLAVHVWTVNDEAPMDRLLDLGVDGIMTDRPTLLRAVLRRRGAWVG